MSSELGKDAALKQANAILAHSELAPEPVDVEVQQAYAAGNASAEDLLAHAKKIAEELTGKQP